MVADLGCRRIAFLLLTETYHSDTDPGYLIIVVDLVVGFFFYRVKNVPLFFCFIDLTKAYGTVNHRLLWKILTKAGLPHELIGLIRAFHDGTQGCVHV
jgi:hypothetical protein